jgi:gluconate 5-dehydrogenase
MSDSLFQLADRIALVTGSNGGLGFAIARGLAEAGAVVVLNGRNDEKLQDAVSRLRDSGHTVHGYAFDVTDSEAVDRQTAAIESDLGPIDILVNNAGIQDRRPMAEMPDEVWERVIKTDLTSAFLVSRAVGRLMIPRTRGKIVNICSLMSEVHRPSIANYSAAKGGLKMLTRAMAVEWGKHNIQTNGIGPGYFITEMTQPLVDDPEFNQWICGRTPAGRWGRPEELIGTAVFLAGDASNYVNGQVIYVDGGLLAGL